MAMAIPISGYIANMYLPILKQVAGTQYANILQRAGWGRYVETLPPATPEPVLSGQESHQLIQVCYAMLGEDLYRLFQRNIGTALARAILAGPWAGLPA